MIVTHLFLHHSSLKEDILDGVMAGWITYLHSLVPIPSPAHVSMWYQ